MPHYNIPTDNEIGEKTKALITTDLSVVYSLVSLAGQCGATSYTLKRILGRYLGKA